MNSVPFSNCKDEKEHGKKRCICGGHNTNNSKHNLTHNATRTRLSIRRNRKFKYDNRGEE